MRFSPDLFERRLRDRLETGCGHAPAPARGTLLAGWDTARVSEFLGRELDRGAQARPRLIVIGAGGHAKVIIEILEEHEQLEIAGCVSREPGGEVLDVPILGDDGVLAALYAQGVRKAFVAIGENRARRNAMQRAVAEGFELVNAVSRHSVISPRTRLGCGVAVMPGAVINVMSRIGDGAIVNTGATVDHDCEIGPCAHVAPGANLAGCVTIGEGHHASRL
jgi:UDP-perosamine 4-acetyltransferase